jgi:hypothetical protein
MTMRRHILLVEKFRLTALLLEGRVDFLKQKFIPILAKGFENGDIYIPSNIFEKLDIPKLSTQTAEQNKIRVSLIAEKLFDFIVAVDPDPVKKNTQWLLTIITRKKDPMPLEDLEYAQESLVKFIEMKKTRQISANADINKFKSLSELNSALKGEVEQKTQMVASEAEAMLAQCQIIYNGSDYSIISPQTEDAAKYFGRGTDWCTAWGDPKGEFPTRTNMFATYNNKGPLYIITDKSNNERWQFSFVFGQFMDIHDRSINLDLFFKNHPKVDEVFESLDGEPLDYVAAPSATGDVIVGGKYPVFKVGDWYQIKSAKGPRGKLLFGFKQHIEQASDVSGKWSSLNNQENIQETITELFRKLKITGDPTGESFFAGLYFRDNKWGNAQELAKEVMKVGANFWWSELTVPKNNETFSFLFDNGDCIIDAIIENEIFKIDGFELDQVLGRTRVKTITPEVSKAIVDYLLKNNIKRWGRKTMLMACNLSKDEAERLIIAKPELGDLPIIYKIYGATDKVKSLIADWCEEYDNSTNGEWVNNNLIIQKFPNVESLFDELGTGETFKFFSKMISGDFSLNDYYDAHAESDNVEDLIKSLAPDDLKKLGEYLQKTYPDEVEDDFDDFDPTNASDVFNLFEATDDDDLQRAANRAVEDGTRLGAESEAISLLKRTIEDSDFVYFMSDNGKFAWDTPCAFVVPIAKIVEYIQANGGDADAGEQLYNDGWKEAFEVGIGVEVPYNGFTDYDEEGAKETFADEIAEFI